MKYGIMYYKQTDNIGDDFQTYASKRFLKKIDYYIDREGFDAFVPKKKEYVALIMNGWFMNNKLTWPPSPYIYPLLISMHFTDAGLFNVGDIYIKGKVKKYLEKFDKIGCRDKETIKRLNKYGIKNTYYSGCLTLTLEKFKDVKKEDYICAVDLTDELVEKLKKSTKKEIKVITQNNKELINMSFDQRMKETEKVLKIFQGASLVVTRRLHAMLPSIALGTPVILLKQHGYENEKDRFQDFSAYAGGVYTMKEFAEMDISDIINNPKPNSDEYIEIRNKLIKTCENFIEETEKVELDTSKLPDIDKFKKETEEETTWNYEVGSAVAENEKIKQEEYVKHWDERENWFNSQQEYYEKELAWHKNRIEELEKNSEKLNDQISKFRKSIFGKMYFKLKHDENRD